MARALALAGSLWLLACTMTVAVAQEDAATGRLETLLTRDATDTLPPDLDRAALAGFYAPRDFTPFWFQAGGDRKGAAAVLAALVSADEDGLDPARYRLDALGDHWLFVEAADRALAELLLTDALLRYARDLRRGRFEPRQVDDRWHIQPEDFDPLAVLQRLHTPTDIIAVLPTLAPRHRGYHRLRTALARYRTIAKDGGWPRIAEGPLLQAGDHSPRVVALRQRLLRSGDLQADDTGTAELFDERLEMAVRRFQLRHGLASDGVVGPQTLSALNVPVSARIRQIVRNMERWRWLPRRLEDRFLMVNMAGFTLSLVEQGEATLSMRVIVGRKYRETPAFRGTMRYLVFNPYWNVPRRIARRDLIPAQIRDPRYLSRKGFRILTGWNAHAEELDPEALDWTQFRTRRFPYRLRQDPGPHNSLGRIKFMFPNQFDVYLHDTPARHLFNRPVRTFSSGCIRVEEPVRLAEAVLAGAGQWNSETILSALDNGETRTVRLAAPLPIYLLYFTAWVDADGRVHFRNDVYGRDQLMAEAERRSTPAAIPETVTNATEPAPPVT